MTRRYATRQARVTSPLTDYKTEAAINGLIPEAELMADKTVPDITRNESEGFYEWESRRRRNKIQWDNVFHWNMNRLAFEHGLRRLSVQANLPGFGRKRREN